MRFSFVGRAAAALSLLLAAPAVAAEPASSPLSRSFSSAPLGGSAQAPALWYYGPSYSLYYDQPRGAGTGPVYRPSHQFDPFYGRDFLERSERGQRFGR